METHNDVRYTVFPVYERWRSDRIMHVHTHTHAHIAQTDTHLTHRLKNLGVDIISSSVLIKLLRLWSFCWFPLCV